MINVAAICKNEEKFIVRFLDHVKDADSICIVDTGSTDSTIQLIETWCAAHPDVAVNILLDDGPRNLGRSRSMAASMFPQDQLVVWLDIDEYFSDPNWCAVLRDLNPMGPVYIEMHNGDSHYFQLKAYFKDQHFWKYAAHEVLVEQGHPAPRTSVQTFHIVHTPDRTKQRDYLPELAYDATRYANDPRASFYYCRELCYSVIYGQGSLEEAEAEYRRLMAMNPWADYKALASIEMIGAQYARDKLDIQTIYSAIAARPDRVESYAFGSWTIYQYGDYITALSLAIQGISAADRPSNFLFSSVRTNLEMCLDVARYACVQLNMEQQAVFYHGRLCVIRNEDPTEWMEQNNVLNKVPANGESKETDA